MQAVKRRKTVAGQRRDLKRHVLSRGCDLPVPLLPQVGDRQGG